MTHLPSTDSPYIQTSRSHRDAPYRILNIRSNSVIPEMHMPAPLSSSSVLQITLERKSPEEGEERGILVCINMLIRCFRCNIKISNGVDPSIKYIISETD